MEARDALRSSFKAAEEAIEEKKSQAFEHLSLQPRVWQVRLAEAESAQERRKLELESSP